MDKRMDKANFSPFLGTLSPVGAAAQKGGKKILKSVTKISHSLRGKNRLSLGLHVVLRFFVFLLLFFMQILVKVTNSFKSVLSYFFHFPFIYAL